VGEKRPLVFLFFVGVFFSPLSLVLFKTLSISLVCFLQAHPFSLFFLPASSLSPPTTTRGSESRHAQSAWYVLLVGVGVRGGRARARH